MCNDMKEVPITKKIVHTAHSRASAKYNASNTKAIPFRLNPNTDTDIFEKLSSVDNVQGYLKSLIRDDISKGAK